MRWTLDEIRSQMKANSTGVRKEMERIRAETPGEATELTFGTLHERVNVYIDQILSEFPEEKPEPKESDPPNVEEDSEADADDEGGESKSEREFPKVQEGP